MKEDKVICKICGKKFKRIGNSHLPRVHGITLQEYKILYPEAETISSETRERLSIASTNDHKLHPRTLSEVHKWKISQGNKGRIDSEETRKKKSKAKAGVRMSEEARRKNSEAKRGKNHPFYGKHRSEETKRKVSIGNTGKKRSEETRKLWSDIKKKQWQDPEYIKMMMKALHRKPNKPEKELDLLLQELFPGEYVYNGDFSYGVTLNGMIPDFINVNGQKKVIEMYGDYWHRNDDPNDRIKIFKDLGWDCLIIWEHELYGEKELLIRKIIDFNNGV